MFENKTIKLDDNGIMKEFLITPLPIIPAFKLARELACLCADTSSVKSLMIQQYMHSLLQTGVNVEGVDLEAYKNMLEMDTVSIISQIAVNILNNLDDDKIDSLLPKVLSNVIYLNGTVKQTCIEAMNTGTLVDFTILFGLIKEVLMLNYGGSIERAKKHLVSIVKDTAE